MLQICRRDQNTFRVGGHGIHRPLTGDRSFFDLIRADDCHRGSARADGNWREVPEYLGPAFHLNVSATPLRAGEPG